MRILVVEDEPVLAEALIEVLRAEAYAVDHAYNGAVASELMEINPYDLVVLDRTIPPPSGLELLQIWRQRGRSTPVLMLTGLSDLDDRVDGLNAGADDYLTKPFQFAELLARIRSLLRRREQPYQGLLKVGDLELDRAGRRVTRGGRPLDLRPKEFALLEYLLLKANQVVTRTELVEHVWDDSFDSFSNVVDVTLHRLRKKVDGDRTDPLLHTLKGVGYVLKAPA